MNLRVDLRDDAVRLAGAAEGAPGRHVRRVVAGLADIEQLRLVLGPPELKQRARVLRRHRPRHAVGLRAPAGQQVANTLVRTVACSPRPSSGSALLSRRKPPYRPDPGRSARAGLAARTGHAARTGRAAAGRSAPGPDRTARVGLSARAAARAAPPVEIATCARSAARAGGSTRGRVSPPEPVDPPLRVSPPEPVAPPLPVCDPPPLLLQPPRAQTTATVAPDRRTLGFMGLSLYCCSRLSFVRDSAGPLVFVREARLTNVVVGCSGEHGLEGKRRRVVFVAGVPVKFRA